MSAIPEDVLADMIQEREQQEDARLSDAERARVHLGIVRRLTREQYGSGSIQVRDVECLEAELFKMVPSQMMQGNRSDVVWR